VLGGAAQTHGGAAHAFGKGAQVGAEEVLALGDGAHALFTSRLHGNLSSVAGDLREQGSHARARMRAALGVRRVVRGYQVHGTVVGRVHRNLAHPGAENGLSHDDDHLPREHPQYDGPLHAGPPRGQPPQPAFRADGHAVAAPGIAAMVLAADCVPVVLAARGAVAALHAGWRGLATGVLEEGMRAIRDVGGQGAVAAVIGPCAGVCCYEVGEEVHAALGNTNPHSRHIDLRATARQRLLAAGAAQVSDVEACTICDERFFSHRREGPRAGRQAALAWLV
jgi:YfiH family protein